MNLVRQFNYIAFLLLVLLSTALNAQSDKQKILILTDYLMKNESKTLEQARNEAIASVYGKPIFKDLVYYENSETFFAKIVSEKGSFSRDVNFYMPFKRAVNFKKDLETGRIEVTHAFDNNKIIIKDIELNYEDISYPINASDTNSFTLKIGEYIVDSQETELFVDRYGVSAGVNLQEILAMPEKTKIFRLDAVYKFNAKHRLEFSYYSIENTSFENVQKEFTWGSLKIKPGAELHTYFNTDIYKLNYSYSFYKTNKIDLSFRVGIHLTSIDTGFYGMATISGSKKYTEAESINIAAPLPIIGLGLSYELMPRLKFNYTFDYFFLTVQDLKGNMIDSLLSIEYKLNRYIGVGAGYNNSDMYFDTDTDGMNFKIDHKVSGALVYLILSY